MARKNIIEIIAALLILLFTYAALSKLIDYKTFTYQLSRSPLLTGHENTISWTVPTVEIITVILLLFRSTRITGLLASFVMMLVFTAYITFMLAGKQHLPCSCGGILQGLSWKAHLVFNILFLIVSGAGIYLQLKQETVEHNYALERS